MSPSDLRGDPPRPGLLAVHRSALAWVRVRARRWHVVRWMIAALAASALMLSVTGARSTALKARRQWGDTLAVWVAVGPLDAGQLISPSDVRQRELPIGALPDDPSTADPSGSRLRDAMTSGEVVRIGRLARAGVGTMAARLGPNTRGVTLRIDEGSILAVGDTADLVAMVGGRPVATATRVIATGDGWATFAVAADMVSAVVNELGVGGVTAVLAP